MSDSATYVFKPHERPMLPGSPASPDHPARRRHYYFAIGVLIALTSGLGNALFTVNLNYAQGTLGLYSNEAAWLTAAYLMTNVTANLLLVKFRQEFGLQTFIRYMLAAYALTTLLHLFVDDLWSWVIVRAANGIAASAMSTLTLLYLMQAMPASKRLFGAMMGISIPQLATPLARMVSPGLLISGDWHMLYWFELGLTLAALAASMALPLPPSERSKAFEREDFRTVALLAPGFWLLIAALSQGRIEWWSERAWMGYALAASVLLIVLAFALESRRPNPLINVRWLGTREVLRLIFAAASVRILLSEQTFGSTGLLNVLGMGNEQMVTLNLIIVLASIAGILVALVTFNPASLAPPIVIAVALIAVGSFMDASSTNLTRPAHFYVSQALIGFASLLFLAQTTVIGMSRTLLSGPRNFISFVVVFGMSQSVGGLLGTSLLGTFQTIREKYHSFEIVQSIALTNPQVAARIQGGAGALGGVVGDPVLRNAEGAAQLAGQVTREANILAYNDVFLLLGVLAVAAVFWSLLVHWSIIRRGEVSPVIAMQQAIQRNAAPAGANDDQSN